MTTYVVKRYSAMLVRLVTCKCTNVLCWH